LSKIYSDKAKGAQIRSRIKWVEEGEKNTKFFLGLEKARRSFQHKFLSKRFRCDFYLIIYLNGINWLNKSHRKILNIC
jgi:hypothetical protein